MKPSQGSHLSRCAGSPVLPAPFCSPGCCCCRGWALARAKALVSRSIILSRRHGRMPTRMVHHLRPSAVATAVANRASASLARMRDFSLSSAPPIKSRFPIPLALPCEIMLAILEMLPPESAVSLVCCCRYMHGLYCDDEGTFPADQLWDHLLRRTFPLRLTGAPGPNAPPRLRRSNHFTVSQLSCDWVVYARQLRAVSPNLPCVFRNMLAPSPRLASVQLGAARCSSVQLDAARRSRLDAWLHPHSLPARLPPAFATHSAFASLRRRC
jgi:hypothetical protein